MQINIKLNVCTAKNLTISQQIVKGEKGRKKGEKIIKGEKIMLRLY